VCTLSHWDLSSFDTSIVWWSLVQKFNVLNFFSLYKSLSYTWLVINTYTFSFLFWGCLYNLQEQSIRDKQVVIKEISLLIKSAHKQTTEWSSHMWIRYVMLNTAWRIRICIKKLKNNNRKHEFLSKNRLVTLITVSI